MNSPRGLPLSYVEGEELDAPLITVEIYPKWYELFVIHPDGGIEALLFHELDDGEGTTYVDHCPNPRKVEAYAEKHGMYVDEIALELIAGRWVLGGNTL